MTINTDVGTFGKKSYNILNTPINICAEAGRTFAENTVQAHGLLRAGFRVPAAPNKLCNTD